VQLSHWTFLDFLFVFIILVSIAFAITKGLAREIISLVALITGFVLAVFMYPTVALWFAEYTRTQAVADLLAFLIIFLGTLIIGAVAAFGVNRFIKMASLEWIDRILGAIFGLLRGWIVSSIIVLALIAFPVSQNTVEKSYLAPFLLAGARAAAYVVPTELRDRFYEEYKRVVQAWSEQRKTS
jgi:membrane protein required for colicin V production